jgi:membrane protease YdiL (CAAX protease family)
MNFCVQCGTKVTGSTCAQCGALTADDALLNGDSYTGLDARFDVHLRVPTIEDGQGADGPAAESRVISVAPASLRGSLRRSIVFETWFVMVAFLFPAIVGAVIVLAQHVSGVADIARFPTILEGNPAWNLVLGILDYVTVASVVPVALFLLVRTGQTPVVMGIGWPILEDDFLKGFGLAAAGFLAEVVLVIPFSPLLKDHSGLFSQVTVGKVPAYYVIWGIALSAITSVTEEVFVNGYLITRLHQLGWSDRKSLILSLTLRTSYHIYYGIGFLFTIPLGYFVTRSFQKHRRLNRAIAAHFLYDAVLTTISILT